MMTEYETKIKVMNKTHYEDKLETSKHYMDQMALIKSEIEVGLEVKNQLLNKNRKLYEELTTLSKVIKSNRAHFKEIEKADFVTLEKQLAEYEAKMVKLCDDQNYKDV